MKDACDKCGQPHPRCNGHNNRGEPCMRWPRSDMDVCLKHGANTPVIRAAADRRLLKAEAAHTVARLSMGVAVEADPLEALEAMLWESSGNVVVLRDLVAELPLDEQGIYGQTWHQSGKPTGEAKPHVLVQMYNEERDRLAKLAEACVRLGLDERRVRLAETQARDLFESVTRALASIPAEHRDAFRRALADDLRNRRPAAVAS